MCLKTDVSALKAIPIPKLDHYPNSNVNGLLYRCTASYNPLNVSAIMQIYHVVSYCMFQVRLLGEDEEDGTRSAASGSALRHKSSSSKSKGGSKKGGKGKGKGGKGKKASPSTAAVNEGTDGPCLVRIDRNYLCFELHRYVCLSRFPCKTILTSVRP